MRWYNLKQNKCPQCNKTFFDFQPTFIKCPCGFSISLKRFNEIVNDQNSQTVSRLQQIDENQEALSNL